MRKLLYTFALGLIGAAIVHLAIVFLLPEYSTKDGWSRISAIADYYETVPLQNNPSAPRHASDDPFIEAASCRFNLEDGPLHIRSDGTAPFWTVALFDERGLNTFSLTDRASTTPSLDIVVMTASQMQHFEVEIPTELSQALLLETSVIEGFALVRSFIPDETWQPSVRSFLNDIRCTALPISQSVD